MSLYAVVEEIERAAAEKVIRELVKTASHEAIEEILFALVGSKFWVQDEHDDPIHPDYIIEAVQGVNNEQK